MTAKLKISASTTTKDGQRQFTVAGQKARALLALVEAGPNGRTALEVSSWGLRFAAYCFFLRRDHDLQIITEREDHPGGWHGRHVLIDKVDILRVVGAEKNEAT